MADLDNFFARKDKKKKGKGKKYAVTSGTTMAKSLEQQGPTPSSESEQMKAEKISIPTIPTQDDEWREEEEQQQDLEGLKVQALKLDEREERTEKHQTESGTEKEDDEDESVVQKNSSASPWQNVVTQQTEVVMEPPPPPPSEKTGAYVPPSLRRTLGHQRKSNAPPDIQSDRNFPTLKSSIQTEKKEDRFKNKDFTEVRTGKNAGRSADAQYQAPGLELTNKYTTLESS